MNTAKEFIIETIDQNQDTELRTLSVLVVDDLKVNFLLIKAVLGKLNISLTWAENGYIAIDHIKNGNSTDVVLMDYNMPGIDGLETTLIIKSMHPTIPVISISTFTDNAIFDRSNAPFNAYASKPVNPKELINLIREFTS